MGNGVTSWSYSAYEMYALCPYKFKKIKLEKFPDPPSKALLNGRVKHKDLENFLKGPKGAPVPEAGKHFEWLLRPMHETPGLLIEQQWAFSREWRETKWFKDDRTWLRAVVDAGAIYPDNTVEIIDYKTGKQYATNEDQVELFALSAMVRYPETTSVTTRLAYLDTGAQVMGEHSAADREKLKAKWAAKVRPMFEDTTWAPKPNDKCGWCPLSRSKGGPCRYG